MLVDSHCHLNCLHDLDTRSLENYLQAAKEQGVGYFLCAGIELSLVDDVHRITEKYSNVFSSIGLHPNEPVDSEPTAAELIALTNHSKVIAIGETGLDYFRSEGDLDWQRERFRRHIQAAKKTQLPLIVHSRDAKEDTLRILREEGAQSIGGVLHCFTGDLEMAEQAIAMGFYISFSGIITFTNAKALQEVAKKIPLEKILIETDAPYLAPVPHRGQSNEPAYVRHVADALATLRGERFEIIEHATTDNFFRLFQKAVR